MTVTDPCDARVMRFLWSALLSLLLCACTVVQAEAPGVPEPASAIRGVAYHGMWTSRTDSDRAAILDELGASGATWVRMDVGWHELQPDGPHSYDVAAVAELDVRLHEIERRGLSALVMLWWAPEWSSGTADQAGVPGDPADYARIATWLAKRYPTAVDALQVWNEPNLAHFFASTSARDYAELIKSTFPAVKAVRPDLPIISAGPASMNAAWYRDFYSNDVVGFYDALGAHAYPVVADMPPALCARGSDTGCDVGWLVSLQQRMSDPAAIWVTEFGYSSHPDDPQLAEWQRGVTQIEQAEYTAQMLAYLSGFSQVHAVFVYRDRDHEGLDPHQDGFGVLNADNSPKPVYAVIACGSVAACSEAGASLSRQR